MINEELEETTSTEEELEANEIEDESRTDEEESGDESEVEDSENLSNDGGEDPSITRAKAQKARLTKEISELKAEKESLKKGGQEKGGIATNSELVERTYLAANGIKDKDVQNEVIRLSRKLGMSVDEAMDDADISQRAQVLLKQKEAQRSIAGGTGGAASRSKGVDYYASYFNKHGDFPAGTSNEMISKVVEKLKQ